MSLFDVVKAASLKVDNAPRKRSTYSVLAKLTSEIGELADEVAIVNNDSYKTPGEDGLFGEAVDVLLATLDLLHIYDPNITEEQLMEYAKTKGKKWIEKEFS